MRSLRGKDHQKRQVTARIREQQRCRHRANHRAAHAEAGEEEFAKSERGIMELHFRNARGDVHRKIHHCARGRQHDRADEDVPKIKPRVPGIEQLLGKRHGRTVDVHEASEEMGKSQGGDDAQHGARKGRQALLRPAGDQVHDDARQDGDRQEGYGRGWESVQHQRNE